MNGKEAKPRMQGVRTQSFRMEDHDFLCKASRSKPALLVHYQKSRIRRGKGNRVEGAKTFAASCARALHGTRSGRTRPSTRVRLRVALLPSLSKSLGPSPTPWNRFSSAPIHQHDHQPARRERTRRGVRAGATDGQKPSRSVAVAGGRVGLVSSQVGIPSPAPVAIGFQTARRPRATGSHGERGSGSSSSLRGKGGQFSSGAAARSETLEVERRRSVKSS